MSALDVMIEARQTEVRLAREGNWQFHEQAVKAVAKRLGCPVPMLRDALYRVSIERAQKPIDILDEVYGLLEALATYQQPETPPESPYFGREPEP